MVGGLPWKANAAADEAEAVIPSFPDPSSQPQGTADLPRADAKDELPRKLYVKRSDLQSHGYTPGCPGCKALALGRTQVAHNSVCRNRVATAIVGAQQGATRVKAAREREDEFLAKHVEKTAEMQDAAGSSKVPRRSLIHI